MGKQGRGVRKRRPRTCAGCGSEHSKKEMIRIVRTPQGEVRIDPTGKAPGRGTYLCRDPECVRKARKRKALARALKTGVPQEVYNILLEHYMTSPAPNRAKESPDE
ncbi:MAG: YlxR family protein [Synergistales bacterium]|nr:YlxR family protein [Synergistales bacterium]